MNIKVGSNRCRGGFTLIELLVSVSVSALLLSINAVWIYQTVRYSSQVTQRNRDHQNLTRLADEFRDDVRSCQKIELVSDNEIKLSWQTQGDTSLGANYKIVENEVQLTKQITKSQNRTERFTLAENIVIGWDVSEMPKMIGLLVSRDPAKLADQKSKADQQVDSSDSFPKRPTPPDQMATLLHVRVSPNRWGDKTMQPKSISVSQSEVQPEIQDEPEAQLESEAETDVETESANEADSSDQESEATTSEVK